MLAYASRDGFTRQQYHHRICVAVCQVVQADEAVFDAVEEKFATLTANLLPKLVSINAP